MKVLNTALCVVLVAMMLMLVGHAARAAENYVQAKCETDRGERFEMLIHSGRVVIKFPGASDWRPATSSRDPRNRDLAVIKHIGSQGDAAFALSISTGRGYWIAQGDDGDRREGNMRCLQKLRQFD